MIKKVVSFFRHHHQVNWALADQAMVSGVNFITGILLARFLGIEDFGRFTLVWLAILFVNSIMQALINAPMMSIGPKQSVKERPFYYGAVMAQQGLFSVMTFFLLFWGVFASGFLFPKWDIAALALPLASAGFAFQLQDFVRRYFFSLQRSVAAFICDAVRYLGQVALLYWLFTTNAGNANAANALWVISGTAIIAAIGAVFFLGSLRWDVSVLAKIVKRHWHFSKWLGGTALMQWLLGNLFLVFSGGLLGPAAVGALQAAQNLLGVNHVLFLGLENVVPVRAAAHLKQDGPQGMTGYLKQVTIWGGLVTALVAGLAAALPEFWLNLVYGEEYAGYGFLLQWFAIIYILKFLFIPLRFGLQALENTRPIFQAYVVTGLFSVLSVYPLVQYFGIVGAVLGMVIIQSVLVIIVWFPLSRSLSTSGAAKDK